MYKQENWTCFIDDKVKMISSDYMKTSKSNINEIITKETALGEKPMKKSYQKLICYASCLQIEAGQLTSRSCNFASSFC